MITEKLQITKEILEKNHKACGDNGVGHFLNEVAERLYPNKIDFTEFKTETWERSRRRVLELYHYLDKRTDRTTIAERQVKMELNYEVV